MSIAGPFDGLSPGELEELKERLEAVENLEPPENLDVGSYTALDDKAGESIVHWVSDPPDGVLPDGTVLSEKYEECPETVEDAKDLFLDYIRVLDNNGIADGRVAQNGDLLVLGCECGEEETEAEEGGNNCCVWICYVAQVDLSENMPVGFQLADSTDTARHDKRSGVGVPLEPEEEGVTYRELIVWNTGSSSAGGDIPAVSAAGGGGSYQFVKSLTASPGSPVTFFTRNITIGSPTPVTAIEYLKTATLASPTYAAKTDLTQSVVEGITVTPGNPVPVYADIPVIDPVPQSPTVNTIKSIEYLNLIATQTDVGVAKELKVISAIEHDSTEDPELILPVPVLPGKFELQYCPGNNVCLAIDFSNAKHIELSATNRDLEYKNISVQQQALNYVGNFEGNTFSASPRSGHTKPLTITNTPQTIDVDKIYLSEKLMTTVLTLTNEKKDVNKHTLVQGLKSTVLVEPQTVTPQTALGTLTDLSSGTVTVTATPCGGVEVGEFTGTAAGKSLTPGADGSLTPYPTAEFTVTEETVPTPDIDLFSMQAAQASPVPPLTFTSPVPAVGSSAGSSLAGTANSSSIVVGSQNSQSAFDFTDITKTSTSGWVNLGTATTSGGQVSEVTVSDLPTGETTGLQIPEVEIAANFDDGGADLAGTDIHSELVGRRAIIPIIDDDCCPASGDFKPIQLPTSSTDTEWCKDASDDGSFKKTTTTELTFWEEDYTLECGLVTSCGVEAGAYQTVNLVDEEELIECEVKTLNLSGSASVGVSSGSVSTSTITVDGDLTVDSDTFDITPPSAVQGNVSIPDMDISLVGTPTLALVDSSPQIHVVDTLHLDVSIPCFDIEGTVDVFESVSDPIKATVNEDVGVSGTLDLDVEIDPNATASLTIPVTPLTLTPPTNGIPLTFTGTPTATVGTQEYVVTGPANGIPVTFDGTPTATVQATSVGVTGTAKVAQSGSPTVAIDVDLPIVGGSGPVILSTGAGKVEGQITEETAKLSGNVAVTGVKTSATAQTVPVTSSSLSLNNMFVSGNLTATGTAVRKVSVDVCVGGEPETINFLTTDTGSHIGDDIAGYFIPVGGLPVTGTVSPTGSLGVSGNVGIQSNAPLTVTGGSVNGQEVKVNGTVDVDIAAKTNGVLAHVVAGSEVKVKKDDVPITMADFDVEVKPNETIGVTGGTPVGLTLVSNSAKVNLPTLEADRKITVTGGPIGVTMDSNSITANLSGTPTVSTEEEILTGLGLTVSEGDMTATVKSGETVQVVGYDLDLDISSGQVSVSGEVCPATDSDPVQITIEIDEYLDISISALALALVGNPKVSVPTTPFNITMPSTIPITIPSQTLSVDGDVDCSGTVSFDASSSTTVTITGTEDVIAPKSSTTWTGDVLVQKKPTGTIVDCP